MSKDRTDLVVTWVIRGIEYGYPQCCIGEFVAVALAGTGLQRETRKLNGSGYVPCIECDKKSVQDLVDTINKNRFMSKSPFKDKA